MIKRRDALKEYLTPITSEFSPENSPPRPRPQVSSGALQSMNEAISGFTQEANELRKAMARGETIVEIDPTDIDSSFVKDRLDDFSGEDFDALVQSIRENGQILPVLVRPHPEKSGRYQLAFGHRRVAALRHLGGKVKAFVRELTDDELVIAQGNENLERKDLSFIEKALFAFRLEELGMSRAVIMSTFGTSSKGVLSEMIALARKLPVELIEAIGSAPGVGRPRWDALAAQLATAGDVVWKQAVATANFNKLTSPERFEAILEVLRDPSSRGSKPTRDPAYWAPKDKLVSVTVKATAKKAVVTYEAKDGPSFATYIAQQLDDLYEAFRKSEKTSTGV
ncbi:plasmid partitioning protein RepB [Mesorhizobium australicum]|uniref:Chromosome partitioning protein, ParB family n=1 Tax=Mesorhizobium australicum TaxID=536018 RepID=A0A1X7MQ95_9HYPH|nr:plasmid partitioning protein RepB [Mesorhizobium australicum]SMH26521.1 chromosome partitioning protein, ParB family [Mesorhizobium australicum]